jgi:spore coat protein U-like protein
MFFSFKQLTKNKKSSHIIFDQKKILMALLSGSIIMTSLLSESPALAGSNSASTKASATLAAMCTVSASNVGFGSLATTGYSIVTGTITATCTKSSTYTLTMGQGSAGTAAQAGSCIGSEIWEYPQNGSPYLWCSQYGPSTPAVANMAGVISGAKIPYYIYQDAAQTKAWINTAYSYTGTGIAQNITAYFVSTNGFYNPDNYLDNQTVTITY